MKHAWIVALALAACRSSTKSDHGAPAAASAAPPASIDAGPPATATDTRAPPSTAPPTRTSADALAKVLPPAPGMPIPLATLRPGDTYEQAAKIFAPARDGSLHQEVEGIYVAVSIVTAGSVSADHERQVKLVSSGDVVLPAAEALALVSERWGNPTTLGGQPYWFNPRAGLRATLTQNQVGIDDLRLEVHAYLPLEQLLGDAADRFGFEPRPLIGLPVADAIAAMPVAWMADPPSNGDFFTAELPPTETDEDPTVVMIRVADGKITAVEVPVSGDLQDRATALVAKKGARFHLDDAQGRVIEGP